MRGHNVGSPWQGTAGNKVWFWGTPCEGRGVWSLMNPGSSLGSISPPAGETSGPQFPHLLIRNCACATPPPGAAGGRQGQCRKRFAKHASSAEHF